MVIKIPDWDKSDSFSIDTTMFGQFVLYVSDIIIAFQNTVKPVAIWVTVKWCVLAVLIRAETLLVSVRFETFKQKVPSETCDLPKVKKGF